MKKMPKYKRGEYNKKYKVETKIVVECTNDFKMSLKDFCRDNNITMANYIRQLIVEDAHSRLNKLINNHNN